MAIKILKSFLMGMGVLIVLGFVFVGYVIYQRTAGVGYFAKHHSESAAPTAALSTLPHTGPGIATALGLPDATRIDSAHPFNNGLLLLVRHPSFGDRVYLVDPRNGAISFALSAGSTAPALPAPEPAPAAGAAEPAATSGK